MIPSTSLTPISTRRRAVLVFEDPVTLFLNKEIVSNDNVQNDGTPVVNEWEVERMMVQSVSCHRIRSYNCIKRRFKLLFFSLDGRAIVFECNMYAPDTWIARTVLMVLSLQMDYRQQGTNIISIIQSSRGLDICGMLRDHCGGFGESAADIHDLLNGSVHDRRVSGGIEEGEDEF